MNQVRIARAAHILPGQRYTGDQWLPARPDCLQDYDLVHQLHEAEFGPGSHWFERREIDDDKLDPDYVRNHREIEARAYGTK